MSTAQQPNPALFVKAVGGGMSADGNVFMLQFMQANGRPVSISFPAAAASSLMLDTEKALGLLFQQQRQILGGQDPRTFFPMGAKRAKTIQGAIGHDGTLVLSLVLATDMRLDLSMPLDAIPGLIGLLQTLQTTQRKGRSKGH
jgi:hypothetical protein